ncbi:MAG: DUF4012 domain-containing protein [Actinobacteria bacterium]|nr:DUF4012 domain-containing protein [Actinomycetota bacterium]MBW3647308.1 DUF4012 domain-containing protein [Actinomycetota bacterium]
MQQNGECRGTGGLAGGFAVVEAERGRLRVTDSGSTADPRRSHPGAGKGAAGLHQPPCRRLPQIWPKVNLSPDLPVVARSSPRAGGRRAGSRSTASSPLTRRLSR